jgi:hypothetical protein
LEGLGLAEEFAEFEASLVELGFTVTGRTFEHGGNLIMLETFDVVKDEDHAVAGGKQGDGALERDAVDRTREHGVAGAEVALGRVFFGGVDGLFERDELEALFAEVHEDEVDGEAVEPGGESGLAAEAAEFAEEVEEGFLGHIFGFGDVAEHAEAEGVDAAFMQGVELGESIGVAVFGAFDGLGFAGNGSIPLEEAGVRFGLHSWEALKIHNQLVRSRLSIERAAWLSYC